MEEKSLITSNELALLQEDRAKNIFYKQIKKDCHQYQDFFQLTDNNLDLEEIKNEIELLLSHILTKETEQDLLQLAYTVDIKEAVFLNAFRSSEIVKSLCFVFLKRWIEKVKFRLNH